MKITRETLLQDAVHGEDGNAFDADTDETMDEFVWHASTFTRNDTYTVGDALERLEDVETRVSLAVKRLKELLDG